MSASVHGRVAVTLKRAWQDGTTRLVFEPLEFLARLAALTPRPEINLLLYHGVLAPHARWRAQVVSYGRPVSEIAVPGPASSGSGPAGAHGPRRPRNSTWAGLMRRAFAIDMLTCPRCGGHLRMVGTLEDPVAVREVLAAPAPGRAGWSRPADRSSNDGVLISSD